METLDWMLPSGIALLFFIGVYVLRGFRVIDQYQRGVIFRFGQVIAERPPGLMWLFSGIDRLVKVDIRTVTVKVAEQETITKDNVPIKVTTVIWYRVMDPISAITKVEACEPSVVQVALTTQRMVIGQHTMDEVLKSQDSLTLTIKTQVDEVTEPWGVKVERVEMQNVEIPESMQRAMAQEAEAIREKRARIIKAEAEKEAAQQLMEAAELVTRNPLAMELRRMQMITEVGAEQNTTTIIMMPSEFVTAAAAFAHHFGKKD